MNLEEKAKKLKTEIPAVFLALKHKDTPILAKVFAAITVIYALSPIDLIPDFIPILGYLDDIILLPVFITLTIKFIPNEVFEKCKTEADSKLKNTNLQKWYYSLPIIILWLIIFFAVLKCLII